MSNLQIIQTLAWGWSAATYRVTKHTLVRWPRISESCSYIYLVAVGFCKFVCHKKSDIKSRVLWSYMKSWQNGEEGKGGRGRGEEKNFAHFSKSCTIQHCSTLSGSVLTHWCSVLLVLTGMHEVATSSFMWVCVSTWQLKYWSTNPQRSGKGIFFAVVGGIAVRCQPESCC